MRKYEHPRNLSLRLRKLLLAVVAVGVLVSAAGAAYAANTPTTRLAATTVIQACQNRSNGNLRLLVNRDATCRTKETRVTWSVIANVGTGVPSPQGNLGVTAPVGDLGPMR